MRTLLSKADPRSRRGGGRKWPANCGNGGTREAQACTIWDFLRLCHSTTICRVHTACLAAGQLFNRQSLNLQRNYTDFGTVRGRSKSPCKPHVVAPFGPTTRCDTRTLIVTWPLVSFPTPPVGRPPTLPTATAGLAAGSDLWCSKVPSISRLAATSSRQLTRCTLLTRDNGFSIAAVFSYNCLMLSPAWMCGPAWQLREVYWVISGAIGVSAAE